MPQPPLPAIAELTREPARYGFHATLKPPMRLRPGASWNALEQAAAELAARLTPFALPPLAIADIHGFLALQETAPCPALQALADAAIATLDGFRAPPDAAELARRRRNGLAPAEEAMLQRWGYPYAFETWFFHMTLTRRLSPAEKAAVEPAAKAHFRAALAQPREVGDLCLFTEAGPEAAFVLAARLPFGG